MDKKIKNNKHLTFEINHRKWGWGGDGVELLIYEITGSGHYPVTHQKMACLFLSLPTYYGINNTNTISDQITGNYWPHTKALDHNKPSHICHQLHSIVSKVVSTFDPATCNLVDYILKTSSLIHFCTKHGLVQTSKHYSFRIFRLVHEITLFCAGCALNINLFIHICRAGLKPIGPIGPCAWFYRPCCELTGNLGRPKLFPIGPRTS